MSDIWINLSLDGSAQRKASKRKLNKKNEWLRRKRHNQRAKGYREDKRNNNQYGQDFRQSQTPLQNGSSIKCPLPPTSTENRGATEASASQSSSRPSGSTHTKPSLTVAAKSKGSDEKPKEPPKSTAFSLGPSVSRTCNPTKYVAIDCEMVGTGPRRLSELARCSIVSYDGDVIYDQFIKPSAKVTDYRTRWSGIRRADLINATPFAKARMEVRKPNFFKRLFTINDLLACFQHVKCIRVIRRAVREAQTKMWGRIQQLQSLQGTGFYLLVLQILKLIKGKVVIGHAVHNDFKVIGYSHPPEMIRDTSRIPLLNEKAGIEGNRCTSLKTLTKAIFSRDIQVGQM